MGAENGQLPGSEKKQIRQRQESKVPRTSVFHILLDRGVITAEPSSHPRDGDVRPYTVNVEQALKILPRIERIDELGQVVSQEERISDERDKTGLLTRAQELFPQVEIGLIVADVLPLSLHQQVNRLVDFENIQITPNEHHRFNYPGATFPKPGQNRGVLEIGESFHAHLENKLQHLTESQGVRLSPRAVRDIALQWGMGHEYGHAIQYALEFVHVDKAVLLNPANKPATVRWKVESHIDRTVHNVIAPDPELVEVLGPDVNESSLFADISGITSERIASGFEMLAFEHALHAEGLTPADVRAISNANKISDRRMYFEHVAALN